MPQPCVIERALAKLRWISGELQSGESLQTHGVMREVFVQIGDDQQEFEHSIALIGVGRVGAFFQVLDYRESIGKNPLEDFWLERPAVLAGLKRFLDPHERFVEKMVQAQLFGGKPRRNFLCATALPATCCDRGIHRPP